MSEVWELFKKYEKSKIALYGLGSETEKVLLEFNTVFEIVGLLDSFQKTGECYGKPIISLEKAIGEGVSLIIVVARPGSCKAIAKKIGDRCKDCDVALLDIRGKDLLVNQQVKYDFANVNAISREEIVHQSTNADVISFDLFDTLVTRKVLEPTDIIELVSCRLSEKGIYIEEFCGMRLAAEKKLSQAYAPSLVEIYDEVLKECVEMGGMPSITASELAELEWSVDEKTLVARADMVQVFKEVHAAGKRVYIVSDTYYSKGQLEHILKLCGIEAWTDILPSCEYKTGKMQDLYECLKEKEPRAQILHIGNDVVADVGAAKEHGLETCQVYSGLDLMESLGYMGVEEQIHNLADRVRMGMFVTRLFNSPFVGADKILITSAEDIGYLFCAPMICDFVCWFRQQIKELKLKNVWLGARDGYLIQKLYEILDADSAKDPRVTYFLTSRTCVVRAGMESEEDIRYVDEMKYHGTLEESLKERFGLDAENLGERDVLAGREGLLKYRDVILHAAQEKRKNYRKYIQELSLADGTIAFFDFVAKGTCQLFLQNIVENPIKGFYFLRLEPDNVRCKDLDIASFYTLEERDSCSIFENYYVLETILTAPHPSVKEFDEEGKAIYAKETRTERDLACVERVQEGIFAFMTDYVNLCPDMEQKENKKLDELLLDLIHKVEIKVDDFLSLVVEDPFFQRMTNITDVI